MNQRPGQWLHLLATVLIAGCATATPRETPATGATGASHTSHERPPTPVATGGMHPDVRFLHHMLAHHAQALVMTALVTERSDRESIRLIAERISVSQRDEIRLMQRHLDRRGGATPTNAVGGDHNHELMPGMLSAEELDRLRAARGLAFDRLFLELMIKHHEGALVMVQQLFASPGAAQSAEMYTLASDVDSDQRAEIQRMRTLLSSLR